MNYTPRLVPLILAVALALLGLRAHAQEAATGIVSGRVMNAANGMYLGMARVVVEGTSIEALTDDTGRYELRGVPTGDVVVRVSYTGQQPISTTVNVSPNARALQDFAFNRPEESADEDMVVLNPYVVNENRYRNAAEIAINQERHSVNIKNVIAADAFGDIPSGNIGEFVKFIPGILIDYGAPGGAGQGTAESDATGVSIRGMGFDDTSITIDGMPVSNAFPGTLTRQTYLDTLSINNASRVEVTKVPTPDMPANSIGGSINLVTKSAFEFARPEISWSVYMTANADHLDLKKTPGPVNKRTYKMRPAANASVVYPITPNFGLSFTASYVPEFKANRRGQPHTYGIPGGNPAGTATPEEAAAFRAAQYAESRLERFQITDTPQMTERRSGNLKLDWRPLEGHTLAVNFQVSTYESIEAQRRLDYRTGVATEWGSDYVIGEANSNNPRVAMTVTTRDRIGDTTSGSFNYRIQRAGWDITAAGSRSVSSSEYQDEGNGHFSEVAAVIGATTNARVRVNFRDIRDGVPGQIEVTDTAGNPIDTTQLSGWRFDGTTAKSGISLSRDTVDVMRVDVRRDLDFLPWGDRFNLAAKVGVRRDEKHNRKWGRGSGYQEDLASGSTLAFADIIDPSYIGQSPGFNHPPQEWLSTYRMYQLDQEQDLFGVFTESRKVSNWDSYANQQKSIKETKDAWYGQLEGRALNGRLRFVGGLRQEQNKREGRGPFLDNRWHSVKNADGTLYREGNQGDPYFNGVRFDQANSGLFTDAALRSRLDALGLIYPREDDALDDTGTRITGSGSGAPRQITGGNSGTLEARKLFRQANKPISQKSKGDPSYSLNLSYDITKDLQAKVAWSRTFGQPRLEDQANNPGLLGGNQNQFTYTEFDQIDDNGKIGRIVVPNPALEPSVANNWDFSLSYYFNEGGKVTASYYWKEITNQQVSYETVRGDPVYDVVLRAIGLDPNEYPDYYVRTSTNGSGLQKTDGFELEIQQNLGILGRFGRPFNVFGSFTKKSLGDPIDPKPITVVIDGQPVNILPIAGTQQTVTQSANTFAAGGIRYDAKRLSVALRGTYRNRNEIARTTITYNQTGVGNTALNYIRTFQPSETRFDLSVDYRVSERFSLFFTGKDIFNNARFQYREDDLGWIPDYAKVTDRRKWGLECTIGVRGRF